MTEQRTIAFTGMTGRLDVPSFVLSENSDLRIALDLSGLKNKSAPVYTFAFTQKEPVATLPCEWLKVGGTEYLEFSLKQYNDMGTKLINGGYMIEPCIVTAEEGCFAVTSIIQELIDKVAALREELNEALDTHRNAVASDLAGFEERLETSISTFNETIESFKSGVAGELESCRIDLEQVSATSDRVLAKMQEYVDNGAEVTFKE